MSKQSEPHRRIPDSVWIAWLVALAVLVLLAINVIHHLSSPAMDMQMHVFRRGESITGPLLSTRLLTAWQLDTVSVAVVALLAAWYATGVLLLRRRTGERWPVRYSVAFAAGLAVCGYATCGAIAVFDQALFTAHMLGHLALVMVVPALLVAGRPATLAVRAARPATGDRIRRVLAGPVLALLTSPPVALASYAAVIVGSHLTGVMDTVMRITWAGQVEHLVYLLVGYQFFVLVIGDEPIRWRLSTPARWALLAVAMAVDTFTGVILLMSTRAVSMYPPPALHVDALSDTRTGGAIMWFGGDAIMAVVMVVLVVGWLRTSGKSERDTAGWLEQARAATLTERTGTGSDGEIDEDDTRRAAYNDWLASMADPPPG